VGGKKKHVVKPNGDRGEVAKSNRREHGKKKNGCRRKVEEPENNHSS